MRINHKPIRNERIDCLNIKIIVVCTSVIILKKKPPK